MLTFHKTTMSRWWFNHEWAFGWIRGKCTTRWSKRSSNEDCFPAVWWITHHHQAFRNEQSTCFSKSWIQLNTEDFTSGWGSTETNRWLQLLTPSPINTCTSSQRERETDSGREREKEGGRVRERETERSHETRAHAQSHAHVHNHMHTQEKHPPHTHTHAHTTHLPTSISMCERIAKARSRNASPDDWANSRSRHHDTGNLLSHNENLPTRTCYCTIQLYSMNSTLLAL